MIENARSAPTEGADDGRNDREPLAVSATETGQSVASDNDRFKVDRHGSDSGADISFNSYLKFHGGMNANDLLETLSCDEMGYPDLSTSPPEDPLDDAPDDAPLEDEQAF
jgi:hypothetical protein